MHRRPYLYGRVCQLLAVGRCFTPTTLPLKLTIIYSHCMLKMLLDTTNQSINLPDTLIEKCFGQNFVHVQHSQIIFMKNSQLCHFVSKKQIPMKIKWSVLWKLGAEIMIEKRHTLTTRAYLMWYSLSVTRRRTIFYSGHSGFLH